MYVRLRTFMIELRAFPESLSFCSETYCALVLEVFQMMKQGSDLAMSSPYVRAMPLSNLKDLDMIERVSSAGNVVIIKITPIAKRSVQETKVAINQLSAFAKRVGGDIARLGEERVVLTPPGIGIWRERNERTLAQSAAE